MYEKIGSAMGSVYWGSCLGFLWFESGVELREVEK